MLLRRAHQIYFIYNRMLKGQKSSHQERIVEHFISLDFRQKFNDIPSQVETEFIIKAN